MPATEQTWYNLKMLHVVFGLTSLLMFISTVWMFADDHDREWKGYQRQFRDIELRLTDWRRRAAASEQQQAQLSELELQKLAAKTLPPSRDMIAEFKQSIVQDFHDRGKLSDAELQQQLEAIETWRQNPESPPDASLQQFSEIDRDYQELVARSQSLADAIVDREQANSVLASLDVKLAKLRAEMAKSADGSAESQREIGTRLSQLSDELAESESEASGSESSYERLAEEVAALRDRLVVAMRNSVGKAKFREDQLLSRRKFRSAELDAAKANLDLAISKGKSQQELDRLQAIIDEIETREGDGLVALDLKRQAATAHRETLQRLVRSMTDPVESIEKSIEQNQAEIARLDTLKVERRSTWFTPVSLPLVGNVPLLPGKRWLELPILDAFGTPLKIDNLWTEGLMTTNGSFGKVRRFDRCTTCHQGIDKTAPGSAVEPAYPAAQQIELSLQTPSSPPKTAEGEPLDLFETYGMALADYGLVDINDATISQIAPQSLAAKAIGMGDAHGDPVEDGLQVGDVILAVNGDRPYGAEEAREMLRYGVKWGEPLSIVVRRGLPQPYSSHPRLDLFVGSLSPHSLAVMGCTSCHEGQGSATAFKYASHTPNSPLQEKEWKKEHDWFHNHHFILPMYASRFAESACLKCHHDVADLEPSERFPDPPAPKVVEGWHLMADNGCYGCHEVNGYDGPDRRVGPDMRLEPSYYAAAAALRDDPGFAALDQFVKDLTENVIQHPFEDASRRELRQFLLTDADADEPQLASASHKMAEVLQDQDTPGDYRKVGPSLRYVAEKLGAPFLVDWIRNPRNFRPSTKMPRVFGLWDHLDSEGLEVAKKYESIELAGIVEYLLDRSQEFDYLTPESGVEPASAERGKLAFELRGCLACHQHEDFPYSDAAQGPNLTGLADKFTGASASPDGEAWLYSWIKRPTHYHARTKMPDLYLDPQAGPDGKLVDPVADIVAYLLEGGKGWQPAADSVAMLDTDSKALDQLVFEHMESAFPRRRADQYLQTGIPTAVGQTLKGAEVELVGEITREKKLNYVGRKAIGKYGCYGCHDIPGFEDAKPIGTAIADWGRKESSKLAFEHIMEYLHEGHGHGHNAAHGASGDSHEVEHPHGEHFDGESNLLAGNGQHAEGDLDPEFNEEFYVDQLEIKDRSGFIWQKLKEPRSYDYKKTENKTYNERLRMPHFQLSNREREAIVTFVLGLVADPPAPQFVHTPDERGKAIVEGRRVLEKYNCSGCHVLEPERWEIEFEPDALAEAPTLNDYPFLAAHFEPEVLRQSAVVNPQRGVLRATLRGMPVISNDNGTPVVLDEDGDEIDPEEEYDPSTLIYPFEIWKPMPFQGETFNVGLRRLEIEAPMIKKRFEARGGDLTRWLLPRVVEVERENNPAANGTEAWSWLPPPLHNEGSKVQPNWLHAFLLEPYPIRPSVFLRMPKFNMSSEEATKLVNYFAAMDAAEYPFEYDSRLLASHVETKSREFMAAHSGVTDRLSHAMQIVTDKNYCIKCHLIGEYVPESDVRALAPNLADVQFRLRPEYVRNWIANPKTILPYTAMPVNIPYDASNDTLGGVSQELYPGTSVEQLDGLVDLLMNYADFTSEKFDVGKLVDAAASGGDESQAAAVEEDRAASAEPIGGQEAEEAVAGVDEVTLAE